MSDDEIGEIKDALKAYKEQIDALREDLKLLIRIGLRDLYAHALIHPALSVSRSNARRRTISVSALETIFALLRFRSIVGTTGFG